MAELSHAERLRAAQAAKAEIEARRAAKAAEREAAEEVAKAEREVQEALALEEAEATHGAVGVMIATVETDLGLVILKRPAAPTFRKFVDGQNHSFAACEKLVSPCLVYPSKEAFAEMLDAQSAILIRCADAVSELAGARAREVAGK